MGEFSDNRNNATRRMATGVGYSRLQKIDFRLLGLALRPAGLEPATLVI
jgi:hypothetical protein